MHCTAGVLEEKLKLGREDRLRRRVGAAAANHRHNWQPPVWTRRLRPHCGGRPCARRHPPRPPSCRRHRPGLGRLDALSTPPAVAAATPRRRMRCLRSLSHAEASGALAPGKLSSGGGESPQRQLCVLSSINLIGGDDCAILGGRPRMCGVCDAACAKA